jgi:DNA mismatch endonuclease, patch repair protein
MKQRSKETISYTMSRIRGKDTGIELLLRRALYKRGARYRHNSSYVFGHPDVSFKGYRLAVFCDSEFWHGYHFADAQKQIKTHRDYWIPKIERNIARDQIVNLELAKQGYQVIRFWGQEIEKDPEGCADKIIAALSARGWRSKS